MSRIGNNPIPVPEGVKVSVNGRIIEISGKNGTHTHHIHKNIKINLNDSVLFFERIDDSSVSRSMHGTTRQIVNNMVVGVSDGFKKILKLLGLGIRQVFKAID
jgi:large subunit ribosomal protein L6